MLSNDEIFAEWGARPDRVYQALRAQGPPWTRDMFRWLHIGLNYDFDSRPHNLAEELADIPYKLSLECVTNASDENLSDLAYLSASGVTILDVARALRIYPERLEALNKAFGLLLTREAKYRSRLLCIVDPGNEPTEFNMGSAFVANACILEDQVLYPNHRVVMNSSRMPNNDPFQWAARNGILFDQVHWYTCNPLTIPERSIKQYRLMTGIVPAVMAVCLTGEFFIRSESCVMLRQAMSK